ncbi:glycosyltransferase family 4 protein [Sinorhizobium sp. RAC02]|uniref:glycosyltransferase family 4 protein n=1 Tax=Sinorhizobium sp. RAC02 TaxID=1842534 RepID=UPI00083CEA17|nr:glycosyltransferase family 4 protein [Sinorhizobium sp. RAC02]AOF93271.1 glycosyl transferases group 1 family protein [Sinorhizobium sp. RAC02]
MKIAFYAPLKSPEHSVPSGDRLMARQIIACLRRAGHDVELASELRALLGDSADEAGYAALQDRAKTEIAQLSARWREDGVPDLWFCYHLYYKAPDLIGPALCKIFGLPYVTVEASYSHRRNIGIWRDMQAKVLDAIRGATVNIGLTARDMEGIRAVAPEAAIATLKPFIDDEIFTGKGAEPEPFRLVTVAMMRPGDKMESYRALAASLRQITDIPWTLSVVGDGPARDDVVALFADFAGDRIEWLGQKEPVDVAKILAKGALYVWPGCGEAYGLAYLEAQAAGLPVVAWATAGVPEVVENGVSGLLTTPGDHAAYGAAIKDLLGNEEKRRRMADDARNRVRNDHSLSAATRTLDTILRRHIGECKL